MKLKVRRKKRFTLFLILKHSCNIPVNIAKKDIIFEKKNDFKGYPF